MKYSAQEHIHRYSAWAASRAASVKNCRFSVQVGKQILELAELNHFVANPEKLPVPSEIDKVHKQWRLQVIEAAKAENLTFTHGVAAKLINVYLKGSIVCGGHHHHPKVEALHPPIDAVLLKTLKEKDVGSLGEAWHLAEKIRWSKFDSPQYESVISNIRQVMQDEPMWAIEKYWQGHQ
jgi:hypothetical protein